MTAETVSPFEINQVAGFAMRRIAGHPEDLSHTLHVQPPDLERTSC